MIDIEKLEQEVASLKILGLTSKVIAERLKLKMCSIEKLLENVSRKIRANVKTTSIIFLPGIFLYGQKAQIVTARGIAELSK